MIDKLHNEGLDQLKGKIKQRVDDLFDNELAKLEGIESIEIETLIAQGPRAETIIDVCRDIDADMIIMGSSKHIARSSPTTKAVIKSGFAPVLHPDTQVTRALKTNNPVFTHRAIIV
jgi:nucleotide-binding universal stress UspA family protein